ncbi:MAG: 16S rRNA (adenine(1518)-N(6)/adenine(1519)-N(6))-dimethyltransferase RsmA [Microbacteriaceae bacterium]|nr:16S rRNA (adenine(1518)-N(6)/adenine(1519)-N(6))-dimethyltransferase RsmA [Microbacteriaceae bacterium]
MSGSGLAETGAAGAAEDANMAGAADLPETANAASPAENAQNPAAQLLGPAQVRELAAEFGVSPTKKLGQNFVHDPNTVRKIVRLANVPKGAEVLEIGPGLGSLTLGLTEIGASVTAIEIDSALAARLAQTVAQMQPGANLRVIHSDALQVTELPVKPQMFVANLPYNVSVPILMHILQTFESLESGLVMVQQEVGERISARSGSKIYGAPSAKAAWYGDWELAGTVSRKIFWPVPGVDSVLVSFKKFAQPRGTEAERELAFSLITAAFGQRRKMLRQSLQGVCARLDSAESITALLEKCEIASTARAESLDIADFHRIARTVLAQ